MKKILAILTLTSIFFLPECTLRSPQDAEVQFDTAIEAWDHGNYIQSLEGFKNLLSRQDAETWFEKIALTTGELYPVMEIAPDGQNIRFSPDGSSAVFEVNQEDKVLTKIINTDETKKSIKTIEGKNLKLSFDGSLAVYLVQKQSEEALKAFEDARSLSGRDRTRALAQAEIDFSAIAVRNLVSEEETVLDTESLLVTQPFFNSRGNSIFFTGNVKSDKSTSAIYEFPLEKGQLRRLTTGPGFGQNPALAGDNTLIYRISSRNPFDRSFQRTLDSSRQPERIVIQDLISGTRRTYSASSYILDRSATNLAYITQVEDQTVLFTLPLQEGAVPIKVHETSSRLSGIDFSPAGEKITFSEMINNDWEIFVIDTAGQNLKAITSEIQHDRRGRFISEHLIVGIKGESRHQRSYLYNLENGRHIRLLHNNKVRTIAPEYEWAIHPGGQKILFVSERDGDTMSPERGVYLMDMSQTISMGALLERLNASLAEERDLHKKGEQLFSPIESQVRSLVSKVSERRIYEIEQRMSSFGSKYITEPGNALARDYLFELFKSFGYEPELQWFEARGVKTANVLVTLEGTKNPELIYVLSSHFDSNRRSPGADDNTSATAVTLEAARILKASPQPATLIFALFTGEEAGLLGSREFVNQAVKNELNIVGALNNDMIGWCENNRMDNTIRYSNKNIRDIQHAASFLFSELITYDTRYIKSTDAAAYYEEFGDIVGGIGSYPVLGSPFYHQVTDRIETVNFHLIGEVAKSTIASL
ncbi:M28 family peptidase, partial [Acidobacteriota bacterium]